jgi:hypothetical protein
MISAVLITREKEFPEGPLNLIKRNSNITEILIDTECKSMLRRFLLAKNAKNDLIYTQDDDCYVDNIQQLIDEFDGKHITYNCQQYHYDYYKDLVDNKIALIGWGAIFKKEWINVFEEYFKVFPVDELSMFMADRIFTYLNTPHNVVIRPTRHHDELHDKSYRDSLTPGFYDKLKEMVERLKTIK